MALSRSNYFLSALIVAGLHTPLPAWSQTPVGTAAANASDDADPLTPKETVKAAPLAPGAPIAAAKTGVASQHPARSHILGILSDGAAAKGGTRDDRDALAAFYADNGGALLWTTGEGPSPKGMAAIEELARAANFGLSRKGDYAVPSAVPLPSPQAQAEHEVAVSLALMTYARHARGGRTDPGQISRMIDMRPRPFEPKSVIAALAAADDPAAALRAFHPQHDGFKRLLKALVSAHESNASADVIQRIEVNLERWRWMPDDLGAFHVRNNVPEQITRVVKDGEVVLTEKIVVGKPGSPTPVMSADMQFVIFHPSWGVPAGIKANELGPMLRRASLRNQEWFGEGSNASRALGRHQLKVSMNGREVNPDSIDWSKADVRQFHFSQPPSAQNVLGVVKFRFPNKYDVYMHDTSERHLFGSATRAFSHGCMRVQNPVRLAEVILGHDKGWSAEKVRAFVPGGRTSDIALATPVPVHLTYFTATVDDGGALKMHGDLYGMDSRVASAIAGKSIAIASVKTEGAGVPASAQKRERPVRVAAGKAPVQKPWNPFKDW